MITQGTFIEYRCDRCNRAHCVAAKEDEVVLPSEWLCLNCRLALIDVEFEMEKNQLLLKKDMINKQLECEMIKQREEQKKEVERQFHLDSWERIHKANWEAFSR